jgi:hypothetical protein
MTWSASCLRDVPKSRLMLVDGSAVAVGGPTL